MNSAELPEPIDFNWDSGNQTKSLIKHGITATEAEQAFFNFKHIIPDVVHSTNTEPRYVMYGQTNMGKVLFISFTLRQKFIRIISARPASKKERNLYETFKKTA